MGDAAGRAGSTLADRVIRGRADRPGSAPGADRRRCRRPAAPSSWSCVDGAVVGRASGASGAARGRRQLELLADHLGEPRAPAPARASVPPIATRAHRAPADHVPVTVIVQARARGRARSSGACASLERLRTPPDEVARAAPGADATLPDELAACSGTRLVALITTDRRRRPAGSAGSTGLRQSRWSTRSSRVLRRLSRAGAEPAVTGASIVGPRRVRPRGWRRRPDVDRRRAAPSRSCWLRRESPSPARQLVYASAGPRPRALEEPAQLVWRRVAGFRVARPGRRGFRWTPRAPAAAGPGGTAGGAG